MLTRGFYKALRWLVCNDEITRGYFTNMTGAVEFFNYPEYGCTNFLRTGNSSYPSMLTMLTSLDGSIGGVILGTGDTPAKYRDTTLAGDLITTYNYHVDVVTYAEFNGYNSSEITCRYTVTNTGTDAFTVREIALVGCPGYPKAYPYTYGEPIRMIVDRTVLEEPVTIPAGGVGQIEYTIQITNPDDPKT